MSQVTGFATGINREKCFEGFEAPASASCHDDVHSGLWI